ncbi:MAG: hypothetical protein GF344_02810 [Chitinivibrionales bacterium]|nr:hypothetical protein [Chitinivibrionales bacterium]MBD3356012.1 hypothetical protein [Chitinivibrionales bacterium]
MTRYTKPEMREHLKEEVKASAKGGKAGQWSARKAQLLAQQYKEHGGGYIGPKDKRGKHLDHWTEQEWQTQQGSGKADTGDGMKRYLPERAWKLLTEDQKRATDQKKRSAKKQFVPNTRAARAARAYVDHGDATQLDEEQLQRLSTQELRQLARDFDIHGRSNMNKTGLAHTLHEGFEKANTTMKKHELQEKAGSFGIKQAQNKDMLVHEIIRMSQ